MNDFYIFKPFYSEFYNMSIQIELTPELILQIHSEKPDKIACLELSKQSLSSLCPLSLYPKLKSLNISSNFLESLENSGIDKLKEIKEIDVSCNSLIQTTGLSNPSILKLNISFNRIETLESLSKVFFSQNLQYLRCEGNLISLMKPLGTMTGLKTLDLSSNLIEQIQGIENLAVILKKLEELYLNHNKISQLLPTELPSTIKILELRGNLMRQSSFLAKLQNLESLNLESNQLEALSDFPSLPQLSELILSKNFIFLLSFKQEIHEMFPSLQLLDLSHNSLYDRFELLTLSKISSLFELDLQGNPCAAHSNFIENIIKDYPNITVINNTQILKNQE